MIQTESKPALALTFLAAAEGLVRQTIAGLPIALRATRTDLLERFLAKGLPTSKDEEWKYTPLRLLGEASFTLSAGEPEQTRLVGVAGLAEGPRLVFWNGRFRPELSETASLPPGVVFHSLADEIRQGHLPHGLGEIAQLEGKLGTTNDERFTWLNSAGFEDGVFLDIAGGTAVETPIQIVFLSDGPALSFPRVFVRAGENARATIAEFHVGDGSYASISVAEFDLAPQAMLEHTRVQDESPHAFHLAVQSSRQAEGSTYTSTNVQFGARIGRVDADVWVGGEHAETWLNGAYVGRDEQHLDNHTRIDHAVPNCHSFEVYKGILGDRATGVFNGKIFVYPDAQKTDAKQTNQALLLSPNATVDTKPQLEIFADDVKCTHGATVGQLRDDAMFYLQSRGIPAMEARNLLVYAFVAEVLEKIANEALRDALEARLFEKLAENPNK